MTNGTKSFIAGIVGMSVVSLMPGQTVAVAAVPATRTTVTGASALALAAVVIQHSRQLSAYERRTIARLFKGDASFGFTPNKKLSILAESLACRVSNVDISARVCDLTFKSGKRTVKGREANEIYATAATAGVPSQGTAGSVTETISDLECTIDPNEIMQKSGGGAECTFETMK